MNRLIICALAVAMALGLGGCKDEPEPKLDLSKDNDDAATHIMKGEQVPIDKVIPKDDK